MRLSSNRWPIHASVVVLLLALLSRYALFGELSSVRASKAGPGEATVQAAQDFLSGLSEKEKAKATFSFDDEERFHWHFIPKRGKRKGLPMRELSEDKKKVLHKLLKASLSELGYKRAEQVRLLESILRKIEGGKGSFSRDPELYFVSIFGRPHTEKAWGWRFEGHHLSLNFTLRDGKIVSATPHFLGANPAIVADGPHKGLRVLAGVEDVARTLMKSLDEEQLAQALGKEKPVEVQGMEKRSYDGILPAGVAARKLKRKQKQTLRKLLGEYLSNLQEDVRKDVAKRIKDGGFGKIQIAWRGSLNSEEPHSYIVYGPSFVISYANFQNDARHIHAGFRERKGEFGL